MVVLGGWDGYRDANNREMGALRFDPPLHTLLNVLKCEFVSSLDAYVLDLQTFVWRTKPLTRFNEDGSSVSAEG
jgi:hypothetical protein